jgi:hypothetical protein
VEEPERELDDIIDDPRPPEDFDHIIDRYRETAAERFEAQLELLRSLFHGKTHDSEIDTPFGTILSARIDHNWRHKRLKILYRLAKDNSVWTILVPETRLRYLLEGHLDVRNCNERAIGIKVECEH